MSDERCRFNGSAAILRRRDFLASSAALSVAAWRSPHLFADKRAESPRTFPGLITRQHQPANLEMPFPTLDRFITSNDRFFVRSHFAVPDVDAKTWKLRVEGAVQRPLELSLEEIRQLATRTNTVLLECSGNSRVFIVPRPAGLPWEFGAVGTAEWSGVPLAALLDRAGVRDGAVEVILEGSDTGETKEFPVPFQTPGRIPFARSLPIDKARRDVLLAHRMNGEELSKAHGYPLRAVVPDWYGMASVKWLSKIIVTDRPFQGYFQTMEYAYFERRHGIPSLTPVTELQVKSLIARPAVHEVVPRGQAYRVHGAAWTGNTEVTRVEVITSGGKEWQPANLVGKAAPHAWRFWEYTWQVPDRPGPYTLMSRATDRRGRTQPAQHDPDRRNAMINFTMPIAVDVR